MKTLLVAVFAVLASLSSLAQTNTHSVQLTCNSLDVTSIQFHFYRANVSGGPYTQLDTVKVTGCAYTDAGLSAGQTLYYVAKGQDILGDLSGPSNEAKAVLPAPPTAPTGLAATVVP